MRYLLIAIALLLSVSQAWGVVLIQRDGATCSTPTDGDTLNEGFLGTGYENTWSETVGANGAIDEDHTLTGTPPTGSCSEGIQFTNTSGSGEPTLITYNNGSATSYSTTTDIYVEFRVNSVSLNNYDSVMFVAATTYDGTGTRLAALYFVQEGANFVLRASASTSSSNEVISTGTWYTARLHIDATAASSYLQVDSGSQRSFTRADNDWQYIKLGFVVAMASTAALDVEVGRIWVDTP